MLILASKDYLVHRLKDHMLEKVHYSDIKEGDLFIIKPLLSDFKELHIAMEDAKRNEDGSVSLNHRLLWG